MDERQRVLDMIERYIDAHHRGDWDAVRSCLTDDIVAEDHAVGIHLEGIEKVMAGHFATAARFPVRRYDLDRIVVDGDRMVWWGRWTGELAPGLAGPSAHWNTATVDEIGSKRFSPLFARVARIRDGRFAHYADYTMVKGAAA